MYCIIKCIVQGKQARVKNADLRDLSCTVLMQKRKSASPVLNVLTSWCNRQSIAVLQLWSTDKFRKVSPHTNYVCVTVGDQIITSEERVVPITISMTHMKEQIVSATSHLH